MPDDEHYRKLERMYADAPINAYYAPTLRVSRGAAELAIEIDEKFHHALRAVHGSVYFKALDDACWFAANSLIDDVCVLTVSFTIYMVRPVSDGSLRATGRVVHESRRLFVAEGELVDAEGRQLARGSGTFLRTSIPLTAEIGYR